MMIPRNTLSTGTAAATEWHSDTLTNIPTLHVAAHGRDLSGKFMPGNVRQVHIGIMTHPAVPVAATQPARLHGDHRRIRFGVWRGDVSNAERLLKLFENGRLHSAVPVTLRLGALFSIGLVE
jgi:hypothetical protein